MNSTALILVILGSAIILVLAAYTIYLYSKIRTLKKEQEDAEVAAAVKIKDFQNELIQDIRFIARAVLEEQCEITEDRKSTRLNSSHVRISYAVFCLKK